MPPLNHSKKSSFITFSIRRRDKRQKNSNGSFKIIAEAGTLQLFKNHKPKVLHQMDPVDQMIHANISNSRRYMATKPGSLLARYYDTQPDHSHEQRMERDQMVANNRRNGWLANDREPKSI